MRLDVETFTQDLSGYTELRFQENRTIRINCTNGNIVTNTRSAMSGVSARYGVNGKWGLASSSSFDDESVKSVLRDAKKNAEILGRRERASELNYFPTHKSFEKCFFTKKNKRTQKELVEFVKEVDNYIATKYSECNRLVVLSCLDMEKRLLTSLHSSMHTMIPRSFIIIELSLNTPDGVVELYDLVGGSGQFEDVFSEPKDCFSMIDQMYLNLKKKSKAVYAKAGIKDVVLDADLAGILAHEAIGHTTEADIVQGGSVAREYLEKEVASPLITLVDWAHTYEGNLLPVPVFMDDEGVEAEDAVIIENGILKRFMHNKESANIFKTRPLGNARAFEYSDEPLIRMRNTGIARGTSKLEDMIASIEDGYYLVRSSNGQADSTSEFMFGVPLGFEIKNGKIGDAIKDTTISGIAFDVLKSVTMISDDFTWSSGGMCGKKQPIPVGMGGPAIKCRVNIGGK